MRLPGASAAKCAPAATRLLPDPVGVERITFAPETISISASSWAGYSGEALLLGPGGERVEQGVGVGVGGQGLDERGLGDSHGPPIVPCPLNCGGA